MKNHIIVSIAEGKLFLFEENGQLQSFDLNSGLSIGLQGGNLAVLPFGPNGSDTTIRTLEIPPNNVHFNFVFDANAKVLSILLTPVFPTSASAIAGGGKMKLGSMDLTLSRNSLNTASINLGAPEEVITEESLERDIAIVDPSLTLLEWYLLDLSAFNLGLQLEDGDLVLHTLPLVGGSEIM